MLGKVNQLLDEQLTDDEKQTNAIENETNVIEENLEAKGKGNENGKDHPKNEMMTIS